MPYIKKIEIKGFKSFGHKKVKVVLDRGFTAITGPNGSGKSNIIDAALFALGELSMRRLRAENSAKLIFHGSEQAEIRSAKKAKVLIQFDNQDGRIPVDTSTVTISREVGRDGQSVYRLNGRRSSRTHLLEVLSMAGISSTSQNIVLQGTITRLAEVSPIERRKIIEELVGIAQYDAEKAEAEEKLREADVAIRTAMGRIDEVQKRIDALERERNELLRQDFIQKEIEKFKAVKLSHEIAKIQQKLDDSSSQIDKVKTRVEKLRRLRHQLRTRRREIEGEWRKLSSEMVEEGGSRVLKIQIKIGELKSQITELKTKISSGKSSLEGLRRVRKNNKEQHNSIQEEIQENRQRTRELKKKCENFSEEITQKQTEHDNLAAEATQLWENLGENSQRIREIEQELDRYYDKITHLKAEKAKSRETIKIRRRRLRSLRESKEGLKETFDDLQESIDKLKRVKEEQKKQLQNLKSTIEKKNSQKKAVGREIDQAGKIAETARESVIEFSTQRDLAEKIAAEREALNTIEELAELGAISGVYGKLRDLIEIEDTYEKALEVAASGWLDAMVVKDFDTAFTCTETLRRMKLGRIKMIPAQEMKKFESLEIPEEVEVDSTALDCIECKDRYKSAVRFVFGDTLVVSSDEKALELSSEGYRTVTVDGDLYEAGGGLESGYYRAPMNLSAIIPSTEAVESLDKAVAALKEHLSRRSEYIKSFEEEIDNARVEIARLSENISTLDSEIDRVKRSIGRTQNSLKKVNSRITRYENRIKKEKTQIEIHNGKKKATSKEIGKLRKKLEVLREKTDPGHIQEMEVERDRLAEEIISLRQKLGTFQTEKSTLQSQYKNVLKVGAKNAKIQLRKVEQQIKKVKKEVIEALQKKKSLQEEVRDLDKTRSELSETVLSAKEEAKKFTAKMDNIDKELGKLDSEYEPSDELLNELQLKNQTLSLKLEQRQNQLKQYGYEQPLEVTPSQVEDAETSLRMMKFELERIGAVNQLASVHYKEQISRYKKLSVRLNELEREKQAIVEFMEEVERKKRKVFKEAYKEINQNLQNYFSKVTGGGSASLKLENLENPFSGGIDMIVQFPNKPSIVVSGASGGERSVAAVAFIFALKEYTPASFYIMDEVDAHLDAFHVSRLADLLREEAEKNQFIVITLKPEMVDKAQKVYGVYERNGVSNVISAKFLEVTT